MTTDIRDCPPGTAPEWCLRFAYDGEEWLVLIEQRDDHHPACGPWPCATTAIIRTTRKFDSCDDCGWPMADAEPCLRYDFDSLAEAEAAFTRIEAEWRAAKAGVL